MNNDLLNELLAEMIKYYKLKSQLLENECIIDLSKIPMPNLDVEENINK